MIKKVFRFLFLYKTADEHYYARHLASLQLSGCLLEDISSLLTESYLGGK